MTAHDALTRVDHILYNMLLSQIGNVSETRRLFRDALIGDADHRYNEVTVHGRQDRRRMTARARIIEATGIDVHFRKGGIAGDLKLSENVEWRAKALHIIGQRLPDTIVQGMVGEPVTSIVAHPALSDDMIIRDAVRTGDDAVSITVTEATIDVLRVKAGMTDRLEHRRRRTKMRLGAIRAYVCDYAEVVRTRREGERWDIPYALFGAPIILLGVIFFSSITVALLGHDTFGNVAAMVPAAIVLLTIFGYLDVALNNPSIDVHYMPKRADRLKRARISVGATGGIRDY